MNDLSSVTSFLLGLATAAAIFGLVYGGPRLVRSAQRWTTAVLFSSLDTWGQRFAGAASALAIFWLLVLAGAFYSPIAAAAPDTVPSVGGAARFVLSINLWLLVAVIPLAFGAVEAVLDGTRGRAIVGAAPAGYWHLGSLALALALFLPWTVWRRAQRAITRHKQDTHIVEVEIDQYPDVIAEMCRRFEEAGLPAKDTAAPAAVRLPRHLVDRFGPPRFRSGKPYDVRRVKTPGCELTLYVSLLDLVATRQTIGRARTALLNTLPPPGFWWTRSEQARELEATILGRNGQAGEDIPRKLAALEVGGEEWRSLQREYLLTAAQRASADGA